MQAPCPSAFAGREGLPLLGHLVANGWKHIIVTTEDHKVILQSGLGAAVRRDGIVHNSLQAISFGDNVALCSIAAGEQHRQAYECSSPYKVPPTHR